MVYKYEMYFNNIWNDITLYVETNSTVGDRLDQTFNVGSFIIPHIKADKFAGIDLSNRISPWIPVRVTISDDTSESEVLRYFTSDCTRSMVRKTDPKLYKHEVTLIEPTKILQRKTIPDMTVTQPKRNVYSGKFFSNNRSLDTEIESNIYTGNHPFDVTLSTVNNCTDTAIIDGTTAKEMGSKFKLNFTIDVINHQFNDKSWNWNPLNGGIGFWNFTNAQSEITVQIFVNGNPIPIYDKNHYVYPGYGDSVKGATDPRTTTINIEIDRPALSVPETYTVRYTLNGMWDRDYADSYFNLYDQADVNTYLKISTGVDTVDDNIYLDQVVDKIFNNINLTDVNDTPPYKYVLDDNVRPIISGILCPEFTFTNYKAWDAILKISNIVNAVPEIKDDFKTVTFRFLDEVPDISYDQDMFEDETLAQVLNSTVSGLEVNAPNVIEEDIMLNAKIEPYAGGWGSVRSGDELVTQLTDDNASFVTRQPIQKIYKLYIDQVGIHIEHDTLPPLILFGNSTTLNNLTSASYWDITDRVVTDKEWMTFQNTTENKSDAARRDTKTRGNNIYYSQGSKRIQGLGHKTLTVSDMVGTTVAPRAVIETLFTACAHFIDNTPAYSGYRLKAATSSNPEAALYEPHSLYQNLLYRIEYVPLTNARTTVYKYDSYNTEYDLIDFVNEQDKLNDTVNLGKFVATGLNRQGNVEYTTSGKTSKYTKIPEVGFRTYNDLVVNSRDLNLNKNLISYTLQLSKDFINRSEYVGRTSAYRAFEIPSTDIVHRQDKYREFIVLTKSPLDVLTDDFTSLTIEGKQMLSQNFCSLTGANTKPISYGKVGVAKTEGATIDYYDMPINTFALHTTINLQFEFDTNYSAGSNITDETVNTIATKFQKFVQYTDIFGKVYGVDIELYPGSKNDNDYLDADIYPKFNDTIDAANRKAVDLEFVINKDAREKYGINIEYPFITDDYTTIKAYPGLAKFNGLVRSKEDITIGIALFKENDKPSFNQTHISEDMKLETTIGTSVYDSVNKIYGIKFNSIPIEANTRYTGYTVYETTTGELIYSVIEDIAPYAYDWEYTTDTIWFVPRKNLKDNTCPNE